MNVNKKLVLGATTLALSFPVLADQCLTPYVGADVKWNQTKFNGSGTNILSKSYVPGNFFTGIRFNEWAAVELGYSIAQSSRNSITPVGSDFLGFFNGTGSVPIHASTKTRISGFNLNVLGFYPVPFTEVCGMSLFGSLGLASLQVKTRNAFFFEGNETQLFVRNFERRKIVPRVTLGVQQMVSDCFGLRAMWGWEQTSALKTIHPKESSVLTIQPKNSNSIGVGLFYNFG